MTTRHQLTVMLLSAAALPLFLSGLGSTHLWTDEAQTALLGESVLAHGYPLTGTGANSVSAHCGDEAGVGGAHLQIPWLQAYLTAASFALFGASAWSARLPFALLGWACVPLSAWVAALAGGRTFARVAAPLLTGTSVYFLLHARQARYYGLAAALVLVVTGLYLLMRRGRVRPAAIALALTALVLSFDITALGVMAGIALHGAVESVARPSRRRHIGELVHALALPAATLGAWILIASTASSRRGIRLGAMLTNPVYYAVQANAHLLPALVMIPLAIWFLRRCPWRSRRVRDLAAIAMVGAGAIAAASVAPRTFPRYIIAVAPLLLTGTALLLDRVAVAGRSGRLVATALALALIAGVPHKLSNDVVRGMGSLAGRARLHPEESWRPMLIPFLRELREPPAGPIAAVSRYLADNAGPDDVVITTYGVPALRFHTRLDVYGGRTCELPEGRLPDWVWIRPGWGGQTSELAAAWIRDRVPLDRYERIELPTPDRRFENREDPHEHVFENPGPEAPAVVLYRATTPSR